MSNGVYRFDRFVVGSSNRIGVAFLGGPDGSGFELGTDTVNVKLPASKKGCSFTLVIAAVPGEDTAEAVQRFGVALKSVGPSADLKQWTKGGPARWNTPVITADVFHVPDCRTSPEICVE